MQTPKTIFLEGNDPDFDEEADRLQCSEQGIYFNLKHFLLGLGVCSL